MADEITTHTVAKVIFKNSVKETYLAITNDLTQEDIEDTRENIGQMRQMISNSYRDGLKGSIYVGTAIINVAETVSIDFAIHVYKNNVFVEQL